MREEHSTHNAPSAEEQEAFKKIPARLSARSPWPSPTPMSSSGRAANAEHLWPPTDTVLVNTHVASMEDLEEAQAARCVAL